MTVLYAISCAISFVLIIVYIGLFRKKDNWFLLTFLSLCVCNIGYLTEALSRAVEEALLANRIAYLGSVFLPFFLLMSIMRVCKCRFPRYLPFALCVVNTAVLLITASSGYCTLYYRSVSFSVVNGVGQLTKEYGPLHSLYYVYLLSYFAAMVGVIIKAFFKKRIVSYQHALYLAIAVFLNIGIYFIEKTLKLDFEVLSFSYIITELFLLRIYKALEDYDIDRILQDALATDSIGVILFDAERNFMGCNDDAITVFPELNELKLAFPIPETEQILHIAVTPVLTGEKSADSTTYRHGERIYRIFVKPFRRKDNAQGKLLGKAIVISDDTAQQEYLQLISSYNERLEREVTQKTRHVLAMHDNLIMSMADMVEGRDPNTGGHIKRTSSVVQIFVRKLQEVGYGGLSEQFLKEVAKAAPMHDLGKIAIDDAILRKPGKYTDAEYRIMQTHAEKGAEIVGKILKREDNEMFYTIAVNVAHYHHEKYDGTGYPAHLKSEAIPVEARIMALADVFDALVSKRCYKEKYSYTEAFDIIRDALGQHFDPALGTLFLSCANELTLCYNALQKGDAS